MLTNIHLRSLFLFLFLIFPVYISAAQGTFYVISNPEKVSILNQYEQPLTELEKKQLFSFVPFEIINRNEILGDKLTEAIKCKNLGETYFLLKNDKGDLLTSGQIYYQKFFSGTILGDTVETTRPVVLSERFPSEGKQIKVSAGEKTVRIFQSGNSVCLFKISSPRQYGWCSDPGALKKTRAAIQKSASLSDDSLIVERIRKRLQLANDTYRQYFDYFNNLTSKQKSTPMWEIKKEKSSVFCTLKGSQETIDQLQESTRYIVQDIEQLLLGKSMTVAYTNNQIIISPR